MQQLDTLPLKQRMSPLTHPAVLVIGGAEDKIHGREILQTFFERSGGKDARIAVIPCASREPAAIAERYRRIFAEMGAELIQAMDIRDRLQSEDQVWKEKLETCTGVFITGGDQVRL
ncbi:MAG: Type 1 glutamine amidotransferase-like domain-containing protein, partial [Cyanobacteria bacterium P01_D01_bin.128]